MRDREAARALSHMSVHTRAQVYVIDRDGRHRALAQLVPGSVYLELGLTGPGSAVVNPWDVDDPATLEPAKVAFLMRLHGLLIGRHDRGTRLAGLSARERRLMSIAIRDVYARAADGEGVPSQGFLRAVLADLARQERADPAADGTNAATYEELAGRLADLCAGGTYGHVLDRPTELRPGDAPLVVVGTSDVPPEIAAAVLLAVVELVSRLARRPGGPRVTLLSDALESPPAADELPPAFARDSLLDGLHESYLRRRMRAGETHSIAYLHAISDVAHFLHPPMTLARAGDLSHPPQ